VRNKSSRSASSHTLNTSHATIWYMMRNGRTYPSRPNHYQAQFLENARDVDAASAYESPYSKALEDFMGRCLALDLSKRPDIQHLQHDVTVSVNALNRNNGNWLGKGREELPEWWRMDVQEDQGLRVGRPLGNIKRRRLVGGLLLMYGDGDGADL
jgi:hypothetical protein